MTTPVERWIDVSGKDGRYQVSDLGNLWSVRRNAPLKPHTLKSGHQQVDLGRGDRRYVHHLVLEAFVGPRPEGAQACHFDDDPSNNRLDNLRWDTRSSNSHDAVRNGRSHTANRTECPHGHAYTEANTYVYQRKDGGYSRFCRTCDRDRPRRG